MIWNWIMKICMKLECPLHPMKHKVVYCFLCSIVSFHFWDPRPLFIKQGGISPPNFVKSRSLEIGFKRIWEGMFDIKLQLQQNTMKVVCILIYIFIGFQYYFRQIHPIIESLIARFMGPIWGPSGADRTLVGPMLAPWTLLSGIKEPDIHSIEEVASLHVYLFDELTNQLTTPTPSNTIWQWRHWLVMTKTMACCLTVPTLYVNQCWLDISVSHPSETLQKKHKISNKNYHFKLNCWNKFSISHGTICENAVCILWLQVSGLIKEFLFGYLMHPMKFLSISHSMSRCINILKARQNVHHFASIISKCTLLNQKATFD